MKDSDVTTLDANGMVLSPSMFMHMYTMLKRANIAPNKVEVNDPSLREEFNTLGGLPMHRNKSLSSDAVTFFKDESIVGEIRNLQKPVVTSYLNAHQCSYDLQN